MNTDGKDAKDNKNEQNVENNNNENLENENNDNENQSENKLSKIPDILQEVKEVKEVKEVQEIKEVKEVKEVKEFKEVKEVEEVKVVRSIIIEELSDSKQVINAAKNIIILPISSTNTVGGISVTRSKSGGILINNQISVIKPIKNQSRVSVQTKTSAPVSTQSSIVNSENETTISTQSSIVTSSEPVSVETSVQNSEPGVLSNQLSLSYDTSELEPVSLYSFHAAHNSINHFEIEMKPTSTVNQPISMCSIGSVVCRICHNAEEPERLISPCLCKGTLAYVHKYCLEHWLRTSGMVSCELCHYRFKVRASLRYTCLQSLRMWYSHPNNRGLLQADFLVCSLLTVVSFGLVGISMMALQHFVLQGRRYGVSRFWTQICILMFLSVISFVYSINMFLILKSQLVPWYTWWQSAKDVTLILENRKSDLALSRFKEKQKNSEEIELDSMIISRETRQQIASPTPPPILTPMLLPLVNAATSPLTSSVNAATSHNSRANDYVATV